MRGIGLALIAGLLAAWPAVASAGELTIRANSAGAAPYVDYYGAAGETNTVTATLSLGGHVMDVVDSGAVMTTISEPHKATYAGDFYPCQIINAHHGRCFTPVPGQYPERLSAGLTAETLAPALDRFSMHFVDGDTTYAPSPRSEPFSTDVFVGSGGGGSTITAGPGAKSSIVTWAGHNVIRTVADDGTVTGGSGPDEIYAANGKPDWIVCHEDVDTVEADVDDFVYSDCENVTRV